MKLQFLIIGFCMGLLLSCTDSINNPNTCPSDTYRGEFRAKVDNVDWSACPYAKKITIPFISGDTYSEQSGVLSRIVTFTMPEIIGRFNVTNRNIQIDSNVIVSWDEFDHDIARAKYSPNPNRPGEFVEIICYDTISRRITGNFAFTVFMRSNDGLDDYPDSLVITEGYFDTYFVK